MQKDDSVISLFSGAGGLSYGFSQAGIKPVFGADLNGDACRSYEMNIGTPCLQIDLGNVEPAAVKRLTGVSQPLAIVGGPPCQGFSTAGPRNSDDPRNKLIFNYLAIVEALAPRWFVFENVEGLLTSGGGKDVARLVRAFVGLGYSVRLQKVNLASFGVPQTRKRVLLIGNSIGVNFDFPPETHSYNSGKAKKISGLPLAPTLDEALAGLGRAATSRDVRVPYATEVAENAFDFLMRKGNPAGAVTEHFQCSGSNMENQIRLLKPGQTMKDLPEKFWHSSYERRANRRVSDGMPSEKRGGPPSGIKRLRGNLQALTITGAASREFIHPSEHRPLTIRECARIQTFPDHYQWAGNSASVIQQVGNAVPPMAAKVLAEHIQRIDGQFGSELKSPDRSAKAELLGFVLTDASGMSPALRNTQSLLAEMYQRSFEFNGN